ncbi:MAG: IS200/IS605 family transposase [Phycisphaerales bacterium]
MPRNVYWEMFFHIVWRTKTNMPLLTAKVEPLTHKYLIHRALETAGVLVHAVGGIEDHIHMAVSLPPTVEPAKWIGDLKGACAHAINHGPCGAGSLAWQTGYGIVTFGKGDLPWVIEYIQNQRTHHGRGSVVARLEEIEQPEGEREEAR